MELRPLDTSQESLIRYQQLFSAVFPAHPKFSPSALHWLYAQNPDGEAVGCDAYDGDRLAAHYACIPTRSRVHGKIVKGLLSLNTSTHPDYQGQGLFPKLAKKTYEKAAELGFDHVQGAANAQSTPLYIKKLGFREIRQVDALVGFGGLGVDLEAASRDAEYEQVWSGDALRWRMQNPNNPVRASATKDGWSFHARSFSKFVPAYGELGNATISGVPMHDEMVGRAPLSAMRLYIGLVPGSAGKPKGYFSIPERLKPSPLNFLFQSFHDSSINIDPESIHYTFLDFDAY
jgi:GNAT superfamily N-acetyltransferase